MNGDIVCLQEINPNHASADLNNGTILPGEKGDDLSYARDLGYDFVMEKKGNDFMRTVILYKRHLYKNSPKSLSSRKYVAVRLEPIAGSRLEGTKPIVVISTHLPAMDSAHSNGVGILAAVLKTIAKKLVKSNDAVVIGGDFNLLTSDSNNAPACHFLKNGSIDKGYEWKDNSNLFKYNFSAKKHDFNTFSDAVTQLNQSRNTFVVPDLFAKFKNNEDDAFDSENLQIDDFTSAFSNAVNNVFNQIYAYKRDIQDDSDEESEEDVSAIFGDGDDVNFGSNDHQETKTNQNTDTLTPHQVELWILQIHGDKDIRTMDGANQERLAKCKMITNATKDDTWWNSKRSVKYKHEIAAKYNEIALSSSASSLRLSRQDFHIIMKVECNTNPWSVQYDFEVYQVDWENTATERPPYTRQLDKIFYNGIHLIASEKQRSIHEKEIQKEKLMFEKCDYLPNEDHPSDHLAVTADFVIGKAVNTVGIDAVSTAKKNKNKKQNKKQKHLPMSDEVVQVLELAKSFGSIIDYNNYIASGADQQSKSFKGIFGGRYLWKCFEEKHLKNVIVGKKEIKKIKQMIQRRATQICDAVL